MFLLTDEIVTAILTKLDRRVSHKCVAIFGCVRFLEEYDFVL